MAAKKRTCKFGRTKAGKCRKTKKSRGLSGFKDKEFSIHMETMENLSKASDYDQATRTEACGEALHALVELGRTHGFKESGVPTIHRAQRLFGKHCLCTGK